VPSFAKPPLGALLSQQIEGVKDSIAKLAAAESTELASLVEMSELCSPTP
jgi:hypothetical protein